VRTGRLVLDRPREPIFADNLRVIRRGGRCRTSRSTSPNTSERFGLLLQPLHAGRDDGEAPLWPFLAKRIRSKHVIKRCDGAQLQDIATLVEANAIKPIIDRVLAPRRRSGSAPLERSNRTRGKIVLRVGD